MLLSAVILTSLATAAVTAKNILLTNDDGWASTPIRATYRDLSEAGHNVYLVAPAEQRSGFGGQFEWTYTNTLFHDDAFGYLKEGDPAWGHEDFDDHIWYFNATPAACVSFAFDYLLPTYFAGVEIDLVVAGPNEGSNPGDYFTLSGTMGATYNAVYRDYSAIAFSGANENNSFYRDSLNDDPNDPQNIYASKVVELVDTLFDNQGDNEKVLPLAVGLNVNFPLVSTDSDYNCTDPKFTFSRQTGQQVIIAGLQYNPGTNLFDWYDKNGTAATAHSYHGDASLPSESLVLNSNGCYIPVSAFTVDYTAPLIQQQQVRSSIRSVLVEYEY